MHDDDTTSQANQLQCNAIGVLNAGVSVRGATMHYVMYVCMYRSSYMLNFTHCASANDTDNFSNDECDDNVMVSLVTVDVVPYTNSKSSN